MTLLLLSITVAITVILGGALALVSLRSGLRPVVAGPGPAIVAHASATTAHWLDSGWMKTVTFLIAVIFFGVLLYRTSIVDWDPAALWRDEPIWIWVLAIGILLFAISRFKFGSVTLTPNITFMRILISFLVLAAFFLLLWQKYPNAPLFNTAEGYAHIAWYFALAALLYMVNHYLEGKPWFTYLVLVIIMFAMLGPRTALLLDPSGGLLRNFDPSAWLRRSAPTTVVNVVTRDRCAGVYERMTLTTTPTPIPNCWFDYSVIRGTIILHKEDGTPQTVRAGQTVGVDRDAKYLSWESVGSPAEVHAAFCPKGSSWNGSRCS
jgi:hypothetical protein